MSKLLCPIRRELLDIYQHAIDSVKPEKLVQNAIEFVDNNKLILGQTTNGSCPNETTVVEFGSKTSLHVVGAGKSVLGMAMGLADKAQKAGLSHLFSHGAISLPIGLKSTSLELNTNVLRSIGVKCLFGSANNLPDKDSVASTEFIINEIKVACDEDLANGSEPLFIVLISGGGSACLTSPKCIELDKKLEIIKFLVQKGADIVELNKVRRCFSNVKGGQLANLILKSHSKSRLVSLILSDVIGDSLEYIASGPTIVTDDEHVGDNHFEAMSLILNKYGYDDIETIVSTLKSNEVADANREGTIINKIIGNNSVAISAAIKRARELDYCVLEMSNDFQGDTETIVERICNFSLNAFQDDSIISDKVLMVGGGEAIVNKRDNETWGIGGRAQEMALDYMIAKMSPGVVLPSTVHDLFLAGTTDGQDGPTDVAACLASYQSFLKDSTFELADAKQAKLAHDSYSFWSKYKPDWLIKTGLTGTNVMDIFLHSLTKI